VLAGSRDDLHYEQFAGFRKKLETLLHESGAADRVHFVGSVDNPEAYYRAADVFLFASALEGMGNVLLEAMASELTVVTTPFIGLPEEIGVHGEQYLLTERTPEAMSAAVQQAYQDRVNGNAIGRRAREWAVEHLSLERTMDQYAQLYRQIVERRRSANKPESREARLVSSSAP
jgi:glycosyltransferase involved in cell wall biosynthesis